ncbi:hypothetical protein U1Q18_024233 [Sarracenia purpurea var. burkii]
MTDQQTEVEKSPELQVRRSRRRRGSSPISGDLGLGQVGDRCGLEDTGGLIKCGLTRAQWFSTKNHKQRWRASEQSDKRGNWKFGQYSDVDACTVLSGNRIPIDLLGIVFAKIQA